MSNHQVIRETIAAAFDLSENSRPLSEAYALAVHPWQDTPTLPPNILRQIYTELLSTHNLSQVHPFDAYSDRLYRLADIMVENGMAELASKYMQAAQTLACATDLLKTDAKRDREVISAYAIPPNGSAHNEIHLANGSGTTLAPDSPQTQDDVMKLLAMLSALDTEEPENRSSAISALTPQTTSRLVELLQHRLGVESPYKRFDKALDSFDSREQDILLRRTLVLNSPLTLDELAEVWSISGERVRQLESTAFARFSEAVEPIIRPMASASLIPALRVILRSEALTSKALQLGAKSNYPEAFAKALLLSCDELHESDGWICNLSTIEDLSEAQEGFSQSFQQNGFVKDTEVHSFFGSLFNDRDDMVTFLTEQIKYGRCKEYWTDKNTNCQRLISCLKFLGCEADKETLGEHTLLDLGAITNALANTHETMRVSSTAWALRELGMAEYSGLFSTAKQILNELGGVVAVTRLEHLLVQQGFSMNTIRATLATPAFHTAGSTIKLATAEQMAPSLPAESESSLRIDGKWGFVVKVQDIHLHGHSFQIPQAIAYANGVNPNDSLVVPVAGQAEYQASIIWRPHTINRTVHIGRLRQWMEFNNVEQGQELIISPTAQELAVSIPS